MAPDFEPLVLRCMLHEPGFVTKYRSVLSIDGLFNLPDMSYLANVLIVFHDEYRQQPTREIAVDRVRRGDYRARAAVCKFIEESLPVENAGYVGDRVIEWARWQRIDQVVESDVRDNPRSFASRVDVASRIGEGLNGGTATLEAGNVGDVVDLQRHRVPLPWSRLNALLRGGPELQDLCVFETFINVGKTTLLINVAGSAIQQGEIVCFGTFEDGEVKIRRRFMQYVADATIDDLLQRPEYVRDLTARFMEQTGGVLKIKKLRSRRSSVQDMEAFVRATEEEYGRPVRLAISDYADRFAPPSHRKDPRHEYREVFEECKLMAADLDLVHWTATQANRESKGKDVVGLEFTGESIGKVESPDLVIGAGQTEADTISGSMTLFNAKVRDAKKHESLRVIADMDRQRIYDPEDL